MVCTASDGTNSADHTNSPLTFKQQSVCANALTKNDAWAVENLYVRSKWPYNWQTGMDKDTNL